MSESRSETVAAFDFDGTLARGDTLVPFLARACGPLPVARALFIAFWRGVLTRTFSRDAAKQAVLGRLLAGQPEDRLVVMAEAYADHVVAKRLRRRVRERLDEHRRAGHRVVIVSASPALYLVPVARRLGIEAVLATVLEVDATRTLTGRLVGANCRGPEKVARLQAWLGGSTATVWAYGRGAGDAHMLKGADRAVHVRRWRRLSTNGTEFVGTSR